VAELSVVEVIVRIAVGALLGAVVGIERESAGQDAGFRTHLLLAMGCALFGVVSVGAFDPFVDDSGSTNVQVDVTRIASYVAAGIGFIGGGAILKHSGAVRGLTTAASIWAAAAIGLAAGLGFWVGAIAATGIALVALAGLRPLSDWVHRRSRTPRSITALVNGLDRSGELTGLMSTIRTNRLKALHIDPRTDRSSGDPLAEVTIEFWDDPDDRLLDEIIGRMQATLGDDLHSIDVTR
jgi:putative Mg2+ transporter-C (MgtC) family protein